MPGEQSPHFGDQLLRDLDERLGLVLEGGLVLRDRLLLGLLLVVREQAADTLLVPARRELRLLAHIFRRLRRLNASSGFPVSSKDVTTNTLAPSAPGRSSTGLASTCSASTSVTPWRCRCGSPV